MGSIDPAPAVVIASVFYPSNYPQASKPTIGLTASQEAVLKEAAARFKTHQEYADDNITSMVVGYAKTRGEKKFNLQLSDRRAELVKQYLVSQGIPEDKIQIRAEGQQQQLSRDDVAKL